MGNTTNGRVLQVTRYALSMHSIVTESAKVKSGSAGVAFKAAVAEAVARATGARCVLPV